MTSQADGNRPDTESRRTPMEHAKLMIRYFERRNEDHPDEVWSRGLEITRAWLKLLEAESVSEGDALAFVHLMHANRYRSSAWFDLALGVYSWAQSRNLPIPPDDEYWDSENLPGGTPSPELDPRNLPSKEYAEVLVRHFSKCADEDPGQRIWESGLEVALMWLHLTQTPSITYVDAEPLVRIVCEHSHQSNGWFSLELGVYYWCCANGFSSLWPPDSWVVRLSA